MAKSLAEKLREGIKIAKKKIKRATLITTLLISLAGCEECNPIPNFAPIITSNPIEEVVRVVDELGISKKVARLKPIGVVKG